MIQNEIDKAKQLFKLYGKTILEDKDISELLEKYKKAIENTWKTMENLKVTETCSECAKGEPGGCCFQDVETWYSDFQLLINMLMGAEIPSNRMYDNSCMFVGEQGCMLPSRNAFCINFLCDKIKNLISKKDIINLYATAGKEIDCGIRLENAIKNWLTENKVQL